MSSAEWGVWSWDARNRSWLEVDTGTKREMKQSLDRKRAAAARHLPEARFTLCRPGQVPDWDPTEREPADA